MEKDGLQFVSFAKAFLNTSGWVFWGGPGEFRKVTDTHLLTVKFEGLEAKFLIAPDMDEEDGGPVDFFQVYDLNVELPTFLADVMKAEHLARCVSSIRQ